MVVMVIVIVISCMHVKLVMSFKSVGGKGIQLLLSLFTAVTLSYPSYIFIYNFILLITPRFEPKNLRKITNLFNHLINRLGLGFEFDHHFNLLRN